MAKSSQRQRSSVLVFDKAFEIIDALSTRGDLSVAEIAEEVSAPRSTVYRLVASLQDHGYVEAGSKRATYRLGIRLLELGSLVQARFDIRKAAVPIMERLHEETEETVFLCIRRGEMAVCVERIDGLNVQSLALRLGGAMPLHAGGAPKAILAFDPQEERDHYIEEHAGQAGAGGRSSRGGNLREELDSIRTSGYAVSDEDVTVGIAAIGAPIFDHRGQVCGALSVSGIRALILGAETSRMARLLVDGANEVSAALGHQVERAIVSGN